MWLSSLDRFLCECYCRMLRLEWSLGLSAVGLGHQRRADKASSSTVDDILMQSAPSSSNRLTCNRGRHLDQSYRIGSDCMEYSRMERGRKDGRSEIEMK